VSFDLLLFTGLSLLAIFCGLMTVLTKNPVHAVLYIVGCFFAIAGHYLLLSAQFLAVVQVIVYAGAIMVLFLSTLMLMNLNEETERHKPALAKISAVVAAGVLGLVLVAILHKAGQIGPATAGDGSFATINNLGRVLLNEYLFPFEFASVLFLSAMIGAVLLTKKDKVAAQ
jgi:NADH-quinone oxidoreductase subunit J